MVLPADTYAKAPSRDIDGTKLKFTKVEIHIKG